MTVFGRQDLLREAAGLVARARLAEDSQKAADLIKQPAAYCRLDSRFDPTVLFSPGMNLNNAKFLSVHAAWNQGES